MHCPIDELITDCRTELRANIFDVVEIAPDQTLHLNKLDYSNLSDQQVRSLWRTKLSWRRGKLVGATLNNTKERERAMKWLLKFAKADRFRWQGKPFEIPTGQKPNPIATWKRTLGSDGLALDPKSCRVLVADFSPWREQKAA